MSLRKSFIVALIVWGGSFVFISRLGTWAPLAVLGPLLAAALVSADPEARGLLRPSARLFALGVAGAAVMTFATYALFALLTQPVPQLRALTAALYDDLRAPSFTPGARAAIIPLVAAAEEILFRGVALPGGRSAPRAVAVNALLVGAVHLTSGNWLLALVAALCGAAWGALRVATRSCVPSIVTHVVWDLAILVVRPLL